MYFNFWNFPQFGIFFSSFEAHRNWCRRKFVGFSFIKYVAFKIIRNFLFFKCIIKLFLIKRNKSVNFSVMILFEKKKRNLLISESQTHFFSIIATFQGSQDFLSTLDTMKNLIRKKTIVRSTYNRRKYH